MKIEHKRLYEQVIKELHSKYEHGEMEIGKKLPPERELAEDFGVSRGTLRDAFRVLESQGIIETRPGGGRVLVKEINSTTQNGQQLINEIRKAAIIDLLEAREIMEIGMIELVCQRATDDELETLKKVLTTRSKSGEIESKSNDFIFHYSLAEYSRNHVLVNFMKLNLDVINETRKMNFSKQNHYEEAHQEHFDILNALQRRNSNVAKQAVIQHLENIRKRLDH